MGSLSNLYISQSYQSLIHLGTNNTASATLIDLQDGLGNSIGVSVNTGGDLSLAGNLTASLQEGYVWVGNSMGKTITVPTSSFIDTFVSGNLVTTASFNAYTSSNDQKVNSLISATASYAISSSVAAVDAAQQAQINSLIAFTGSNTNTSLNAYTASQNSFNASATASIQDLLNLSSSLSGGYATQGELDAVSSSLNNSINTKLNTSSFNAYTQSNDQRVSSLETNSASVNISISNINQFTASNGNTSLNQFTASQINFNNSATASISELLSFSSSLDVTYVTQNELASATGSLINQIDTKLNTSSFNAYTASNDSKVNSLINATASYANSASVATVDYNQQQQIDSLIAVTASFLTSSTDITSLNAFTASQETKNTTLASVTSSLNQFTSSANNRLNNLESTSASVNISIANINSTTASQATSISNLNTFSQSANTQLTNLSASQSIDNTKWDTLGGQTGSFITESETASFARTNIDNNFSANQTFTNITAISASFTYVQTTYETSSVIYSSGSNQFGDELTDIQTLSGSVKIQGGLTINGVDITGSLNNLNSFTASALTNSASVNSSLTNLNQFTSSQETKNTTLATYTASVDSSLANINTFTASNGNTSLNAYTSSNDSKVNALINATASYAISSSVAIVDAAQQLQINSLIAATSSYAISSSVSTLVSSSIQSLSASLTVTDEFLQAQITALDASGSAASVAALNAFTASQLIINTGYNTFTSSANQRLGSLETNSASVNTSISNINQFTQSAQSSINALNNASSSYVTETESGSFLITASVNLNTLTFTKGDNTTFAVTVNTGSATDITSLNAFTASQLTINTGYNTFTQSAQQSINSLNAATASYAISSSVAAVDAAQQSQIDNLISVTGSYVTESETGSFARTNIDNNFSANQTFTNITAVSASFTYVQTTYETSSVIYSSGSNEFGDELSDTQTLSGSVKVQGSLTVNGTPVQTSSVDISSLNAFTASQDTKNSTLATYTASVDSQLSSLTNATASYAISSSVAAVDAGQQSQINSLIAATGSYITTPLTSLNSFTASQETKNATLGSLTGSFATTGSNTFIGNQTLTGSLFISGNINMVNGADIVTHHVKAPGANGVEIQTNTGGVVALFGAGGSLGTTFYGQINATSISASTINGLGDPLVFSTSVDSRLDSLEGVSGSFTTTASFNSYTSSTDSRLTNIEATTASLNTSVAALNQFTASQDTKNSTLASYTASVDSSLSNINTFTASNGNTSLNSYTSSNDAKWNTLGGQTGSYVTSAITASSLITASFSGNTLTFTKGDASTFGVVIPDVSGSSIPNGTISSSAQITGLGFVSSSVTASSLVTASVNLNTITFTKGDASTFNITVNTGSGTSTDLTSLNAFTASQYVSNSFFATTGSNIFTGDQTIASANNLIVSGSLVTFSGLNFPAGLLNGLISFASSNSNLRIDNASLNVDNTFSASLQEGYVWVGNASGRTSLVPTSSFGGGGTINTGSFATTGSNTFTGDQTFIDNAGNFFTITDASGSMMLVGKSYTSASAHLSASVPSPSGSFVNLIFKTNNNTADTIISGSNNIFVNPATNTAGFKRYMGSNNIFNTAGLPQISGSMAFPVTMNQNIGPFAMTMRGPVSSSTWTISTNIAAGTISVGTNATNHAQGLVSGLSMQGNNIGGTVFLIANQSNHTSSTSINSNNINGSVQLTLSSSAATFSNNTINDNNFILTNQYYTSSAGTGAITVSRNTIGGASNTILTTGIADAGASQPSIINSTIGGSANNIHSNASGAGSRNSVNAIIVFGNTLIVSASSNSATTNEYGSAFFGRHNAVDGVRAKTSETIFAVGTGRSATKKTGFLIDSGSNTFVEGTFNVSGSSTFTGSLNGMLLTQGPGKNSTGLGNNVLQNSVSGGNVAIGDSALSANTSGTDNVAIGASALNVNTSGDRNIAIGANVLDSNTIGALNVGIGNATLSGLVDGTSNVGIGFESLKNQTTGSYNVAIGNQTLNQNISGSSNIAFGAFAGYNETGSGNFYIGNNQYGSINADRSGSLMWGKMDNTTANQTLQINAKTNVTNELLLTRGSNKQSDIVSVNGSATISNSLVTSNSIILVTTQNGVVGTDEYPAVVTNKGAGTFDIQHNYSGNLDVGYLIINN